MAPPLPLTGLRVVDLSQNLAGPYGTQVLADFGADVIKVEPPGGDPARTWGPPFMGGESPLFLCANRGKRSVVLDLEAERDREALRRLVARAHVFVQAFRAGVIERLGFHYDAVRALRPGIVYVSVTAFGTQGPLRDQPGYDPLVQAFSGLMSVTGHAGAPPTRLGTSVADMGTGLWTALAVMAELAARGWPPAADAAEAEASRNREPEATHITTALLDTSVAWMAYHLQGYLASGAVPGPMGSGLGMIAPYQAFATADGHVMIAAGNDAIFGRLCAALDVPGLADDVRFRTNADRVENREALVEALEERTRRETAGAVLARLGERSVPCAPIHDVAALAAHPQLAASELLRSVAGGVPDYTDVAMPVRWDGERAPARRGPPPVGAHTEDVLKELGLAP